MRKEDFYRLVDALQTYYRDETPVPDATMASWLAVVRDLPITSENMAWFQQRVEVLYNGFPQNLPRVLWGLAQDWQKSNPRSARKYCSCCDSGWITARKWDPTLKLEAEYTFGCTCAPIKGVRATTVAELQRRGYTIVSPVSP